MRKFIVLLFLMVISCMGNGAEKEKNISNVKLEQELELQGISVTDAMSVISKEYGVSIVTDEGIKDIILDLSFPKGERIKTVLDSIISMHNLKMKKIGKTWILSKRMKSASGEVNLAGKVTVKGYENGIEGVKVTVLKSHSPGAYTTYGGRFVINDLDPGVYIVRFEKNGYTTVGEIVNLENTNTDMTISMEREKGSKKEDKITETPKEERKLKSTVIDGERYYTERVKLLNVPAEEIKTMLENTYDGMIRVTPVPKVNAVIMFGKKEIVDAARSVIKDVDTGIKQVRVSSQILDVSDNLFEELGFDWVYSDNGKITDKKGTNTSLLKNGIIDGIGTNFASGIGLIRQFNNGSDMLGLTINMLQATQDLVISAIPSILIADGEEGEFKITEEVIVGEEKDENNETSKTRYTPLFREAGIILKVTPMIQENDLIIVKVKIEVSNFKLKKTANGEDTGTYNSEGGSKVGRTIETVVKMKNGETIFIGGLKRAMIHNLDSKVPVVGEIPVIGNLFKNRSVKKETTDIYIRLKVDIADNEKDDFESTEIHQNYKKIENRKIY